MLWWLITKGVYVSRLIPDMSNHLSGSSLKWQEGLQESSFGFFQFTFSVLRVFYCCYVCSTPIRWATQICLGTKKLKHVNLTFIVNQQNERAVHHPAVAAESSFSHFVFWPTYHNQRRCPQTLCSKTRSPPHASSDFLCYHSLKRRYDRKSESKTGKRAKASELTIRRFLLFDAVTASWKASALLSWVKRNHIAR